jgi:hypothetical protein
MAAISLLIVAALSGCAGLSTAPSPALQQQTEAARSRADHEALAKYYDAEIAKARTSAAEHRQVARTYQASPAIVRGGGSMSAHCNAIAGSYGGIAAQFEGMACSHRQMAEQAKP